MSRSITAQTPKSRSLYLNTSVDDVPDAGILVDSWHTFKALPLYNFSYSKRSLRVYARCLSSYIKKEQKSNIGVLVSNNEDVRVSFSVIEGLAVSPDDDKGLKIEVVSKKPDDKKKSLFVAIMASVERSLESNERTNFDKFIVLPLLLARGTRLFLKAFLKFLEEMFSCLVQHLTFSSYQMSWMLAMWAGSGGDNGRKPLFVQYVLPLKTLKTIDYSIDAEGSYNLWKKVHDPDSNEMNEDEVSAFIDELEYFFMKAIGTDLSYFHIQSIGTAAAAVHRNGRIKILKKDSIHYVLRHLTSLCQELNIT